MKLCTGMKLFIMRGYMDLRYEYIDNSLPEEGRQPMFYLLPLMKRKEHPTEVLIEYCPYCGKRLYEIDTHDYCGVERCKDLELHVQLGFIDDHYEDIDNKGYVRVVQLAGDGSFGSGIMIRHCPECGEMVCDLATDRTVCQFDTGERDPKWGDTPFVICHWDTFESDPELATFKIGETDSLRKAIEIIEKKYSDRIADNGADRVEVIDPDGDVILRFNVK